MTKKILLLSLLLFSIFAFNTSYAQDISIIEGAEIKSKMSMIKVVGEFDNNVVAVFYSKKKYYLRSYNENLEIVKYKELDLSYKGKEMDYAGVVEIKNRLFSLARFNNKKTKKNYLLYQEIDPKTFNVIKKLSVLGEIPYSKKRNDGGFSFVYSQNQQRVLIYHFLPYDKGGKQKLAFSVLDSNLTKIWGKKITLPYSDKLFAIHDFEVDDEGNVYIIGKKWRGKRKDIVDGKVNFEFYILRYRKDESDNQEYKLALKGKYITQVKLAMDPKLNLICAGFYSNNKGYGGLGGSFMLKIDHKDGDIITSDYQDFSVEFMTSLMSKRKKEKAKKKSKKMKKKGKSFEMPVYDLDNLVIRDDGGVLLVAEREFVISHTHTDANGNTYTTYTYYTNNIIVVNFNPDGSVKWMRRVPKSQSAGGTYYLSYVSATYEDNIYFIYNDYIKNKDIRDEKEFRHFAVNLKYANLVAYKINGKGETDYLPLFPAGKGSTLVVPKRSTQLKHSNDIILYSVAKKKQRLYRIVFEEE